MSQRSYRKLLFETTCSDDNATSVFVEVILEDVTLSRCMLVCLGYVNVNTRPVTLNSCHQADKGPNYECQGVTEVHVDC